MYITKSFTYILWLASNITKMDHKLSIFPCQKQERDKLQTKLKTQFGQLEGSGQNASDIPSHMLNYSQLLFGFQNWHTNSQGLCSIWAPQRNISDK